MVSSGSKLEKKTDFSTSDGRFYIGRSYRSFPQITNVSSWRGPVRGDVNGWRFDFMMELHIGENGRVTIHAPDGTAHDFALSNGSFAAAKGVVQTGYSLSFVGSPPSNWNDVTAASQQWRVTDPSRRVWILKTFNRDINEKNNYIIGRPISLLSPDGYQLNFSYGPSDELAAISDNLGRAFSISWRFYNITAVKDFEGSRPVPEAISQIGLPGGGQLRYTYDPAPANPSVGRVQRLTKVEKIDAAGHVTGSFSYHYENTRFPNLLTGISDERGVRFATFAYDASGRTTASMHAGSNQTYSLSFGGTASSPTTTVINPLGKAEVYNFTRTGEGDVRLVSIDGQPSANCVASTRRITYDTNKFIATETDEEGRVTAYVRDALGRPTSITRGSGTPQVSTTTILWHPTFNLPVRTVEPGLTTDFAYGATGQLTQVTQTDTTSQTVPFSTNGRVRAWTYGYATTGLLTSVDGPLPGPGDTVSYTYNSNGFLQTATNELGQVSTVTAWNGRGQPTSVTGPDSVVTAFAYDDAGRLTGMTINPGPSQTAWSFSYTPAGDLATYTEPAGASYTLTWDEARRLIKVTNTLGESVTYARDAMGNATAKTITAADGSTQMFRLANTFDELGRLIKQVGGQGRTWSFAYDRTGNLTTVTDPRGKALGFGFDALSRLVTETERDGGVVQHAYNAKDEETTYTDPRNLATTYVRNGFGEVIQETSPDRGTTVYDYDARGLMIRKTDARGVTTTYSSDAAGRLTSRSYPTAALNESFGYDDTAGGPTGRGRLTRMQDAAGSSDFYYDAVGRVTGEVRTIGGHAHTVAYTYDAAGSGRLLFLTYPSGRVVTYGYDALGRVNSVGLKMSATAPEQVIASWAGYFPFGGLRGLTFGNGLNMWSNNDLEYRLDGLFLDQASGGPSLITRYHWVGDGLNLMALNNDTIDPGQTQRFTYDDAARLLTATGPYGSLSWSYDKVGNRLSETRTVAGTTSTQCERALDPPHLWACNFPHPPGRP
ncbi:DUF6531 domain-containing protein [Methylobacterium sp. CB376]|nr:DUF6531 domain-containing protein [Methylobacterium nodulans]WFT82595.1 DUF6531 domain-containing protein [Methylobacterium nodulans]